jgi:hypothetical protein
VKRGQSRHTARWRCLSVTSNYWECGLSGAILGRASLDATSTAGTLCYL